MKKYLFLLLVVLLGMTTLNAHPVDVEKAKVIGQKFACTKINSQLKSNDLQLVYTGFSDRNEACFYAFNAGENGFVIVSADDRFRPIVGYSDEGPFETENMSPELAFYLGKIIEARTSRNAVILDDVQEEWQSLMTTGQLLSRNGGRGVDYLCSTKWNQDSPYNLYAPEANGGPGGRCYAGCVATAMSQVMKHWDHPAQGTGSHSYYSNYGLLSANFGATTYHWELMPDRLGGASQEQIEAVALLMYHCGVAVDMGFSPSGSGAYSTDVPDAVNRYFSYSSHATLKNREYYSLTNWQNMLKESFDIGWPVYYSGYSNSGGHAFVCDGYNDNDLFHYNWGWGGSSDGWFVIDEIDYAGWAQAIFNYVPSDVYDYMPLQPDNFIVESQGDFDYSATLSWTNPTQDIHLQNLTSIDQIVVTRDGEIIYTEDNVSPGAGMTFTDHYIPTKVSYKVYAVCHNVKGVEAFSDEVILGPTCTWHIDMTSNGSQGWNEGYISLVNSAGVEIARLAPTSSSSSYNFVMPLGHTDFNWKAPAQIIDKISFTIKDNEGNTVVAFDGASNELNKGLFFVANNSCGNDINRTAPTNLVATRDSGDVNLNWDAPEGTVRHYNIYRDNLLCAITQENSFIDTNVNQSIHNYFVTAVNETSESDPSNISSVYQGNFTCEAPSNFRFEMTNNTRVKVMWDEPQDENLTGYILYRRSKGQEFKRIKQLTHPYHTDNLSSQPDGCYEYAVSAYYSQSNCESDYASIQDNPDWHFIEVNKSIVPQHLDFRIHQGHVVLEWQEATMADAYNVYRNGERIAQGVTGIAFTDYEASPSQTYHYTVTGYTTFIESSPSNEIYVDWTTGINEGTDEEMVKIYPNPTSGLVYIEGEDIQMVNVFNMLGQSVIPQVGGAHHITLDLRALPQGSYFINVVTETGIRTSKVVKIN